MTNYGKARYLKILDLEFIDPNSVLLPETQLSIVAYFETKYNIKIQHKNQPLLLMENKKVKDDQIKTYMLP